MASRARPSWSSSSTSSPASPALTAHIVLPSLWAKALSVGVEQNKTFVDADNASAGERVANDRVGQSEDIVNEPADGVGMDRGRRGRSVGPRCTFMVGTDIVVEDDGIDGTTE
jgi:hypothetical protein